MIDTLTLRKKRNIKWSSNIAYAVGLIATDGNLSKNGRCIEITSKDIEQIENFKKCLNIDNKIGWKTSGYSDKLYPRIQYPNVQFYRWLVSIGLTPNKTKTIESLKIPDRYFFDFLRGCLDGDGCTYSYWDPRWKSSFMLYMVFVSGSLKHLKWLNKEIFRLLKIKGRIKSGTRSWQLVYAKNASKIIIQNLYKKKDCVYLTRKRIKIIESLKEENK